MAENKQYRQQTRQQDILRLDMIMFRHEFQPVSEGLSDLKKGSTPLQDQLIYVLSSGNVLRSGGVCMCLAGERII